MVWWPFATKPERADTLEVTDLHSVAPPLYSTVNEIKLPNAGLPTKKPEDPNILYSMRSLRLNFSFTMVADSKRLHRSISDFI